MVVFKVMLRTVTWLAAFLWGIVYILFALSIIFWIVGKVQLMSKEIVSEAKRRTIEGRL